MRNGTTDVAKERAMARLYDLLNLQKELFLKYDEQKFNVFIFGSYPTIRYVEGKSDVDIAIYTTDFKLYLQISTDIENYFNKKNIESDIFFIDTSMVSPFYCAPLNAQIRFTDYYPEELVVFEQRCHHK